MCTYVHGIYTYFMPINTGILDEFNTREFTLESVGIQSHNPERRFAKQETISVCLKKQESKRRKMKTKKILATIISLIVIMSMVVSCAPKSTGSEGGKIKVGLSFSDFATERWKNEEVLMRGLLEDKGYEVISQEANHDVKLQNDQIDNMVARASRA